MAGSLNKVTLIGNVGKDPEVRNTQGGKVVANFSIATSESWTDKTSGERSEKTEWHNIVVWGPLAEIVEKYVQKGSKLYIEGKLQTRSWEKDGKKNYTTEIVLQGFGAQLILLSGRQDGGGGERAGSRAAERSTGGGGDGWKPQNQPAGGGGWDDDIPF
jgi:single-strand DNA-binding protein